MKRSLLGYIYKLSAVAIAGLIMQACGVDIKPEPSCNFVQNSKLQRVSWKGQHAKMYIHSSVPVQFHRNIREAAEVWNQQVGYKVISIESIVSGKASPSQDGYNIIYWMSSVWEANKKTEQARTTIYWKGSHIYEADIRINAKNHRFSSEIEPLNAKVDFYSLMVHEFGHVLGLAHVNEEKPSVMHAHLSNGKERRELYSLDKDTLNCEYGG